MKSGTGERDDLSDGKKAWLVMQQHNGCGSFFCFFFPTDWFSAAMEILMNMTIRQEL